MLTIDASVWINADSPAEPNHQFSRRLLDRVAATGTPIIVPTLLRVEVAGVISRTRNNPALGRDFANRLAALPFVRWVPLDEPLSVRATTLAADLGLRGADAVYAAVAVANGYTLISLDREHLTRLPSVVPVYPPAAAPIP